MCTYLRAMCVDVLPLQSLSTQNQKGPSAAHQVAINSPQENGEIITQERGSEGADEIMYPFSVLTPSKANWLSSRNGKPLI